MRTPLKLMMVPGIALLAAAAMHAQITNPIPNPVIKRGLSVEIRDVVRLPETRRLRPADQDVTPAGWARVSFVRDLPDGRRFANDSRGLLYLLNGSNPPTVYANIGAAFPFANYNRLESGFIGFAFHPEFASNGLFYTVTSEVAKGNPATPNFIPPGFTQADVNFHNVITEWHATNPAATTFEGTRREIIRIGQIVSTLTHPFGDVEFNPTARPGSPDYGLLYTSGSDMGFSNGGPPHNNNPSQTQRLDTLVSAVLRIDPRSPSVSGGTRGFGDYTVPAINKFAADGDPKTLRRNLRVRVPQHASALLGSHRRHDVRFRHRHEQRRGDQHHPRGRELRLDEARGDLGKRHLPARAARSISSLRCRRRS